MSTAQKQALTFTRTVQAPPEEVYRAFTNAGAIREWMCDGSVAATREGGSYHLWWNDGYYTSGEFKTLEPHKRIVTTWLGRGEPAPTEVEVTITAEGDGSRINLVHSGMGEGDGWDELNELFKQGWEAGLENLHSVLEDGIDLRIVRRPMLGIIVSRQIDKETAKEEGHPFEAGVQIGQTIEGMGAEAAGLKGGDIITRMADTPITNFQSFAVAVAPYHAGDEVEVDFYREGRKHTITMALSKRPMPEVPDNPKELADQLDELLSQLRGEIAEIVDGLSNEVASHPPEEDEWNVKQVLAHLILGDRGTNQYLATVVSDNETINFANNIQAQHDAVVAIYPKVETLMEEWKRTDDELVSFVANLSEEFVAHRASYKRMGQFLLQSAYHPQSHHEQLREAIAAAKDE